VAPGGSPAAACRPPSAAIGAADPASHMKPPINRRPIRPDRIRRIERGFAAIENRFLHGGFFASLGQVERSLYFFLVLAADRNGVSFYGYDKICAALAVTPEQYVHARDRLLEADLIAFEAGRFQVLSLPARPCSTTTTSPSHVHPANQPSPPARARTGWCRQDGAKLEAILRALQKP